MLLTTPNPVVGWWSSPSRRIKVKWWWWSGLLGVLRLPTGKVVSVLRWEFWTLGPPPDHPALTRLVLAGFGV